MQIDLPNKHWRHFKEGDDLVFMRESANQYSDKSLSLVFYSSGDYDIHFSQGADYIGHFGAETESGTWKGTQKDTQRVINRAEKLWKKWSKKPAAGLRE